jgi:hypothetical protein
MKDVVKRVFDTIVGFVKKPIQLVIDIIWNNGLRKVYNTAASLIPGMDELPELKLARGGVVPGYAAPAGEAGGAARPQRLTSGVERSRFAAAVVL